MTAPATSDPAARTGRLLRALAPLFTTEKAVSFDPVQMTFLQKLVREATLQKGVTVKKEEFFKAMLYLDYFTEVVAARSTIVGDIQVVVEELEKMAEFLDPDLELLVRYSGLHAIQDLKGEQLFRKASLEQMARRHERTNGAVQLDDGDAGEPDLFHHAAGRMVVDLVAREEVRACLGAARGRNDLKAAVVADCILGILSPDELGPAAGALASGDILRAATDLLAQLVRSSAGWSLRAHVERIRARLGP